MSYYSRIDFKVKFILVKDFTEGKKYQKSIYKCKKSSVLGKKTFQIIYQLSCFVGHPVIDFKENPGTKLNLIADYSTMIS